MMSEVGLQLLDCPRNLGRPENILEAGHHLIGLNLYFQS